MNAVGQQLVLSGIVPIQANIYYVVVYGIVSLD